MLCQTTQPSKQALADVLERVQTLNLERITRKVEHKLGWDAERANRAELQYRRYLALLLLYPEEQIAPPSNDADEIWHGHILDTPAYQEDCEQLFGAFLHHVPSYGSAEETVKMASAREQTEALYERHFGDSLEDGSLTNQEEAFWAGLAASNEKEEARATAAIVKRVQRARGSDGCVPCFGGREDKQAKATSKAKTKSIRSPAALKNKPARTEAGCVPCLGQRSKQEKTASKEEAGCVPCLARSRKTGKASGTVKIM